MSRGPRLTPEKKAAILKDLETKKVKEVALDHKVCEASVFKVKRLAKQQAEVVN